MKFIIALTPVLIFLTSCAPPGMGGAEGESGSPIIAALPFVLIFGLFYFLILRPQQKQSRQKENMMKNIKRGDKVITAGGIHGRVVNTEEELLTVEIAKGVNVQVARANISALIDNQDKAEAKQKGGKQ
jgi:preprotein translocase subunit YajC